jgi:hypothetical protein
MMTRFLLSLLVAAALAAPAAAQQDPIGPPPGPPKPGEEPQPDEPDEPVEPPAPGPSVEELSTQVDALLADVQKLLGAKDLQGAVLRFDRLQAVVARLQEQAGSNEAAKAKLDAIKERWEAASADVEKARADLEAQDRKHAGEGRQRFKREQGSTDGLKGQLERLLQAARGSDAAATAEVIKSFAPDEKAVKDALTDEGWKAIGPRIVEGAGRLFAGEPPQLLERLGLRPELEEVQVYKATTEELLAMELGTDAAREFASALRRTARLLKPRYHWYAAVLRPKGGDGEAARLQLFFHFEGRWVLLGRVWRAEEPPQ